jgi:ketosteroid isomerase-like protein
MSEENVEIVRRALEAGWRRPKPDFATVNDLFHPDHELLSSTTRAEGGSQRGAQGFREVLGSLDEAFESWEGSVEQVRSIDKERVLVTAVMTALGKRGGVPVKQRFWYVVTVRDGKLTRTEGYTSVEEALEAAGLSE